MCDEPRVYPKEPELKDILPRLILSTVMSIIISGLHIGYHYLTHPYDKTLGGWAVGMIIFIFAFIFSWYIFEDAEHEQEKRNKDKNKPNN